MSATQGSTPGRQGAPDRVLPITRALSIVIIPFLLVAFVLLYFWPSADDTARLFAWRITPGFTSMLLAAVYLGAFGSALTFYLWAFALERTTPTRVAISVTVNPITASLVGAALLDEPLRWNLVGGIVTVCAGIWIATTTGRRAAPAT